MLTPLQKRKIIEKKPQTQDRARKNRSNYIHEKSLKKIKKKKNIKWFGEATWL